MNCEIKTKKQQQQQHIIEEQELELRRSRRK